MLTAELTNEQVSTIVHALSQYMDWLEQNNCFLGRERGRCLEEKIKEVSQTRQAILSRAA